jgi:ferredoxin/flavodoxin
MKPKVFIVFISPAGSTRHTATVIEQELKQMGAEVIFLDLKNLKKWPEFQGLITSAAENSCLFAGSPIYRGQAVPPVMSFIVGLGQIHQKYAVPFATWGGSSSGSALWQMGAALKEKGFSIAGAVKVLGFHSLMFDEKDPLGKGRPNAKDNEIIKKMAAKIYTGLKDRRISTLSLKALDYQPEDVSSKNKSAMTRPWKITPRVISEKKCTQCGICQEECPAVAISMAPYPRFGESCFDCLNCIRLCPEKAIELTEDLSGRVEQIKVRAKTRNEMPHTQAFVY